MKLLQFNITSLDTSLEKLWGYQKENKYDVIFLKGNKLNSRKTLTLF